MSKLAPPFDTLLGDELWQAACHNDELTRLIAANERGSLGDFVGDALRPDAKNRREAPISPTGRARQTPG